MAMASWLGKQIANGRIAGLILLALLLLVRVADPALVRDLRNGAFDGYQRLLPRPITQQPVVILDIDDASLAQIGQWPWPRSRFAEIVTRATEAGAVAIAFDVIFAEPDRLSPPRFAAETPGLTAEMRSALAAMPGTDGALAAAMGMSRVVVGQTSIRRVQTATGLATPGVGDEAPPRSVAHAFVGLDPTPFLQSFPDMVRNLPEIEAAATGRGVFTVRPDPDGIHRRVPLVMLVQDVLRLGLAPELLRVATGGQPFAVRSDEAGVSGLVVAGQRVSTAADGSVWPWFSPSSEARFVSVADLLSGRMPPGRLAGHLVLVGTSAIGLEDYRATPLGAMAGVEIHAQVLENILMGTLLQRPNYTIGAELTAIVLLCLMVIALTPRLAAGWVLLAAGALLLGWLAASYGAFSRSRILLDPSFPALALVLSFMLMATANYLREERARRQIRGAFGQYVSPDLVDRLSERPEDLALGGETRDLTLLFTDVRGFTGISETYKTDPQGLTRLMNRLLTTQSRAILDEKGTIDKFMGDAVMAFWNAPLDHPDHAAAACRAALAMIEGLAALNARASEDAEEGGMPLPELNVGVGINTGQCVVGNMGSDTRFDYTALGDPVNLAARLEGASKTYGLHIVVGPETAQAVGGLFALLEIDLIRVMGKSEPVHIFALLGDTRMAENPEFAALSVDNARMLADCRRQEWSACATALDAISARGTAFGLERYTNLYRDRIAALQAAPPGSAWDGVYNATEK